MKVAGRIEKMRAQHQAGEPVAYTLPIGDESIALNPQIGRRVSIEFTGAIRCMHCGRTIRKSFAQGYCYPCFSSLARCDRCIVRPELCHYANGTCREPEWGETHCLVPHTVYLANSSGLKVGITRGIDPISRWIDQGASQGLAIRRARNRLESGLIETACKPFVGDRTNWRRMLGGTPEPLDLYGEREDLLERIARVEDAFELPGMALDAERVVEIRYPVHAYPEKIRSHDLAKVLRLEGTLQGIKGQYWILDTGVLNMRKFGGYELRIDFRD